MMLFSSMIWILIHFIYDLRLDLRELSHPLLRPNDNKTHKSNKSIFQTLNI